MKPKFKFRHQYDEDADAKERAAVRVDTGDESKVQAQYQDEVDINELVRRFGISERMPAAAIDPDFYGDLGDTPDLGSAIRTVREAQERFDALPADLRAKFRNDPARLWDFVHDPKNADEAVELGLLVKNEPPRKDEVAPVSPVAPATPPKADA